MVRAQAFHTQPAFMEIAAIIMNSFGIHATVIRTCIKILLYCSLPLAGRLCMSLAISSPLILQPPGGSFSQYLGLCVPLGGA